MTEPKVVHPATQDRIDFRNHNLDGPADMLPEDLPELGIKRSAFSVWAHSMVATSD
jgi:hypothetical protein